MLITKSQAYELELLDIFRHMQTRQLQWFMLRWGLPAKAFERDMRQLRYLGKVMLLGDHICLPDRPRDDALIASLNIMMCFSMHAIPEFALGKPPARLVFFPMDEQCTKAFRVIPVQAGRERITAAQAEGEYDPGSEILLYIVERPEQMKMIGHAFPCYFAFPGDKPNAYRFVKWKG